MKRYIILALFLLSKLSLISQDINLSITEPTINKLFDAIGSISGDGEYKFVFKSKYTWEIDSTRIDLLSDSAIFITKATVNTHLGQYKDDIVGKVSIDYDQKTNLVSIKVVDATFEVAFNFSGRRFVVKRIQLADYFKKPFHFQGPSQLTNEMSIQMPDGKMKKVKLKPQNFKMIVQDNKISILADMNFFKN